MNVEPIESPAHATNTPSGCAPPVPAQRTPATYEVCGATITAITRLDAAALIVERAAARTGSFQTHLCNAYTLSLLSSDAELASALGEADLNLPDGAPVAWLGRRYGTKGPVYGPDLLGDVVDIGRRHGLKHYLYGGRDGTAQAMAARLRDHAPGLEIVACETPPFRDLTEDELDELAARITACGADVVWVGLGTPRQDYAVPMIARRVNAVVIPVGAAFDYWAGTVKQAPRFLHGSGLEWLFRLMVEPRRLWRRYLVGNPRFVLAAARHARRSRMKNRSV